MTRRTPYNVTYRDLVELAAKMLAYRQQKLNTATAEGTRHLDPLIHDLETAKPCTGF